ncbi:MAG: hypothetical protein H0W01_05375 [Pseudonocardiales bacterium]|nr:hypothetical protein [Pseudonocardiales bacterium]
MTTPSPAQMDRKIRQLDNDVQSIYQMLNGIVGTQTQHGNRLGELDNKLAGVAGTQARHGNRLDEIDGQLAEIAGTQARHGNRLDELDSKLGEMDAKLDTVITMLGEGR